MFSQGQQLRSYTRNRLSASSIQSILCFGNWSRKDLVYMPHLIEAVDAKGNGKKQALDEDSSVKML